MDLWGNFDPDTAEWAPNDEALELWQTVCEFGEKLKDLALNIADCFVAWSPLLGAILEGFLDAVGFLVDIASWLVRCVTWLGEVLSQSNLVKKVFYFIGSLIGPQGIVGALGKVLKLVMTILSKSRIWQGIISGIKRVFDAISNSAPFQKIMGTTAGKATKSAASHSSTILGGLGTFGGVTGLGSIFNNKRQGDDYYKVLGGMRNRTYGQDKSKDAYASQNAKSNIDPKADEKEAKKQARDLLAANKQALKQQTQLIKDNLAEQLEVLKNTMESVKLAFEQYRIGWQQYSAEEAENAVQQQQAKVDAIKKEITATQNSGAFKTQEELTTAIGKLQVELNKETRTLEKLITEQKDVAEVIAFYGKQSLTPYSDKAKAETAWSSEDGPMPESVPLNALGSTEQWLMHYYVSHGLSKDIAAALVGNQKLESGNWSDSAIRGRGISQWDDNRLANVYAFMKQNGLAYADIRNQAAASLDEFTKNYASAVNGAIANGMSASDAVSKIYESPNPAYANNAKRQEYTNNVLANYDESARALLLSASTGLIEGLNAGFNAFANTTMENGRVGCVEAVTKIGSWFSNFLKNEIGNFSVPNLQAHAKSAGVPEIPYDEAKLKPGDVIVYDGDEHVLIYKGNGRTVGNSSSKNKVIEQGIDIGITPTSIIQTGSYGVAENMQTGADIDPKTQAGQKAKKRATEAQKNAQDVAKDFLALLDDESTIQKEQLMESYAEKIKKLNADGYKEQAAQAKRLLEAKTNQLDFKTESNYLKTALNVIESNASDLIYKISDDMYDAADMAKKYLDYYNSNDNYPGGKYGLKSIVDNMYKQMKNATDNSDMKTATEIESKIKSIYKELMGVVDKFVQAVKDKANWRISMIEANPYLTSGQKEGAKGKIERDTKVEEAKAQRIKAEFYYNEAQKLKNQDGSFKDIPNATPENYKSLIALSDSYARAAALNEELTKMIPLMDKVGNTAKQALEDGLLTFLTDAVNEAQSLGEALGNLAITILKELQKMFAKNIIKDLMNTWFPAKQNEGDATTEAYHQTLEISEQIGQLGESLAITADSFQMKAATAASAWNTALGEVTTNFINKVNEECLKLQAAASAIGNSNGVSTANDVASEMAGSGMATIKKATGGYISGPGTSTSDSIPAMLSNGEYVVRANAVRKYGRTMLDQLNSGNFGNLRVRIPKFATGGYVGQTGSTATSSFATSFGASVSPQLHVNNYVDGKRIFDSYGKDVVRTEVRNSIIKNAKFFAETMRRI